MCPTAGGATPAQTLPTCSTPTSILSSWKLIWKSCSGTTMTLSHKVWHIWDKIQKSILTGLYISILYSLYVALIRDVLCAAFRQLVDDFNDYALVGFWFSFMNIPVTLSLRDGSKKEVDYEERLKTTLQGVFMDMVRRGIFKK